MRVSMRELLIGLAVVVALVALFAVHKRTPRSTIRASPMLTPGALNPDVTQVNIHSTICVPGWTATIRPPPDYTDALKVKPDAKGSKKKPLARSSPLRPAAP